jgi:2-keto-4-pentenoate hydratase/2-oxohepta-3-ene-1,7-dioic acid hydratase in catechol pathway
MRLATILVDGGPVVFVLEGDWALAIDDGSSMRDVAASGPEGLARLSAWVDARPDGSFQPMTAVAYGPAVPDPGAIYTFGLNYRPPGVDAARDHDRPPRPLVYGKLPTSVAGEGTILRWDPDLTMDVDAEVELGVVVGVDGAVFGYTIVNDVSSREAWLDGDQWLLGKSMPGFCPVGPVVVTADELDPTDVRLGCTINGVAIQDGRTRDMRYSIPELLDYLGRHVRLEPGDLIATGTPARLATPPGPDRHLEPGDVVTCWIDGIGELTTTIG